MQIIARSVSVRKDVPNKQFISQKSKIFVEDTVILKHVNNKTYYFLGIMGKIEAEYEGETIAIPVTITECTLENGALFVNTKNEKEFTVYSNGPLRKLMDLAKVEDTKDLIGLTLPCINLIGYWTIDMRELENAAS